MRILFTWELGDGAGHMTPYTDLLELLTSAGHEVFFAVKKLNFAKRYLKGAKVTLIQAPIIKTSQENYIPHINSFAKILNNHGYDNPDSIAGLIDAWSFIFDVVKPDLILSDYSPTVLLTAQLYPEIKVFQIGNGFFSPTDTKPIADLDMLQGAPASEERTQGLLEMEDQIVGNINSALESLGKTMRLDRLGAILRSDKNIIMGIPELEYYPGRKDPTYYGFFTSPGGAIPVWPTSDKTKHKVFVYIYYYPAIHTLLQYLKDNEIPSLVIGHGIPPESVKEFECDTLTFIVNRMDLKILAEEATLMIGNGNFGTTCEMILRGVPTISIPIQAEQNILANNMQKLGVNINIPPQSIPRLPQVLDMVLKSPGVYEVYKGNVDLLRTKYGHLLTSDTSKRIFDDIQSFLIE